jgi:hypothetical protein
MPVLPVDMGPSTFVFRKHMITFVPRGPLHWFRRPRRSAGSPAGSPVFDMAEVGPVLSARLFVGLSVGKKKTWTVKDVQRIVVRVRQAQTSLGNSTIVAQDGTYRETFEDELIFEKSLQVIIFNEENFSREKFVRDMKSLAETLQSELKQNKVILEIQEDGIRKQTSFAVP